MNLKQISFPDDAPFSLEQREWLSGYLSALLAPFEKMQETSGIPLTIAWGSQTGTAESLAKKFAKCATKSGLKPSVVDLARLDGSGLIDLGYLVIITSTYGDGDAPDNAQEFYNFIHSENAPSLKGLNYSVLSLGDSSYSEFCKCGIDFDKRLSQLGASPIIDRVDMDVEYEEDFAQWSNDMLAILGTSSVTEEVEIQEGYTKKNPFPAEIIKLENLNSVESARETSHVEISLKESGITYEAGDALGVYPVNDPKLVDDILKNLSFKQDSDWDEQLVRTQLIENYEVRNISPPLLKVWAEKSESATLISLMQEHKKKELSEYLWGREIIDLISEHPIYWNHIDEFLGVLKPLASRLYSISSSPKAHPEEVHLTIGAVKYNSFGRQRNGVCSTYFSDRSGTAKPRIFVHPNKNFRLPSDPMNPLIMLGPGTGIAPFRAFLEEREALGAKGDNWLFFGNPHEKLDFLYREQLEDFQKKGVLKKLSLAFSRDQNEKLYVQHLMLDQGRELYSWLQKGGYFYVCGDASRMAKDVDKALHLVIEKNGMMTAEEAAAYVARLKSEKRYSRDVY